MENIYNNNKLEIRGLNFFLKELSYKDNQKPTGRFGYGVNENYRLIEFEKGKINIEYSREITFEKESPFDIKVTVILEIVYDFAKTLKNYGNEKSLYDDIELMRFDLVNNSPIPNFTSLLISQVIGSFGRVPLVTPPIIND